MRVRESLESPFSLRRLKFDADTTASGLGRKPTRASALMKPTQRLCRKGNRLESRLVSGNCKEFVNLSALKERSTVGAGQSGKSHSMDLREVSQSRMPLRKRWLAGQEQVTPSCFDQGRQARHSGVRSTMLWVRARPRGRDGSGRRHGR